MIADESGITTEQEPTEVAKTQLRRVIIDKRRRLPIQIIMILRRDLRECFGVDFADGWGFFVDYHLSTEIHSYLNWIEYPNGDHVLVEGHKSRVICAVISRDGCYLFTGSNDGWIIKWDLRNNAMITQFKAHSDAVNSLVHSPGILISGSDEMTIKVWNDEEDYPLNFAMKGHTAGVKSLSLNHTGTILVSGSFDCTCRVWSLESGECMREMKGHSESIQCVLFTEDVIITGSWDRSIRIWNAHSGKSIRMIADGILADVYCVSLNCDSSMLACIAEEGFTIFKYPSMRVIQSVFKYSFCACFHPSIPNILAFADQMDHSIRIFRIDDNSEWIRHLNGHTRVIQCLRFTPDGYRLISTSDDHTARVWDVSDLLSQ